MWDDNDLSTALPLSNKESIQLSLFGSFISNNLAEVSNTVEGWDSIPKYFFSPALVKKLRGADGLAKTYLHEFVLKGIPCSIRFQPAQIVGNDGVEKAHFPGVTEELVEEALKKVMTESGNATHDAGEQETWVKFSLRGLHRELKNNGRQRNITQIKDAISIMSACVLTFSVEDKEVWKGSILQDLVTVGRKDYLADSDSLHLARLPLPLSHGMNSLEYRQFNYLRYMSLDDALSRWIFRQMANRYTNANPINDYKFMYQKLGKSGLLQGSERANRRKVINAFEELIEKGAITRYSVENRMVKRKIVDILYIVKPTKGFIGEQKAALKRKKINEDRMKRKTLRK